MRAVTRAGWAAVIIAGLVAAPAAGAAGPTSCAGRGPQHSNGVLIVNREPKGGTPIRSRC